MFHNRYQNLFMREVISIRRKRIIKPWKHFQKVLAIDSNNTYALDRVGLLLFNDGNEK
jgi:hypothetical protein